MAGFYAARFGIFNEVETEPDPNIQSQQPNPQEEQPATDGIKQQDDQVQEQPTENSEQNTTYTQNPQSEDGDNVQNDVIDTSVSGDGSQDSQSNQTYDNGQEPKGEVDAIKKKEEEIYANLSPEQLDIMHKELKSQFLAMFDMTTEVVQRINNISLDTKDVPTIEYASNKLSRLRTMLTDYMNYVYKTKSYTENHINYNIFLAVLNGINKILEEINKN